MSDEKGESVSEARKRRKVEEADMKDHVIVITVFTTNDKQIRLPGLCESDAWDLAHKLRLFGFECAQ